MKLVKKFGFGTIISLIIAYAIYLYADDMGWKLLAFIAKAYLFVYLAIFILIVGIILLIVIVFLISLLFFKKKGYTKKEKIIDAKYKIKE